MEVKTSISKETALLELEKARDGMIRVVNTRIDALKEWILQGDYFLGEISTDEVIYHLCTAPTLFKGTKPTAIYFGDERIEVTKWQTVYTEILRWCAADSDTLCALMGLRNKVSGRKRVILSDTSEGMGKAIKIADGLYAEAYFDTETLVRVLTTHILDAVHYSYDEISVSVVKKNGRR